MTVPSHSQEVVVTGGPHGVTAQLEDLRASADALEQVACELEDLLGMLFLPALDLGALAGVLSPATGARAEAACARFLLAAAGADVRLRGTALAVHASVRAYETTEAVVVRSFELAVSAGAAYLGNAVRALALTPAGVLVIAGAAGMILGGRTAAEAGRVAAQEAGLVDAIDEAFGIDTETLVEHGAEAVTGWAAEVGSRAAHWAGEHPELTETIIDHALPGFVAGLLGHPPTAIPVPVDSELLPRDSQTLTGLLLVGASGLGLFGEQSLRAGAHAPAVNVSRVPGATPPASHAPRGVWELWQRQWSRSRGLDNGQVRVEQIRGSGGPRWIVYVPATTSGALRPGRATTDMASNLETASGRSSAQHETVRQAMRRAGVRGGQEVMMVGYSQGGIVAASLLEDEEFREDYDVSALFTVGSPVSDFAVPAEVDTLSVEHRQDLVPLLDGDGNPDGRHWTTVTADLDEEALRERLAAEGKDAEAIDAQLSRPLYAHGGELYSHTIEDLESGGEPALTAWRERNADFFSGEVGGTHDFEGERG
ncbi:hypothetical protein [Brevibacterium album]|uniref:hypothetical protein n=1 Tax=Brevibacterium album TaxID=417948 RepID=UPI0003F5B726|nr:hypothetical protein [Brevibacterium album]